MKEVKPESLAEALLLLEKMNVRLSEKDQKIREQQYDNLFKYYHFSSIEQMNYSINNETITLWNTPIDSSNFKDLLLTESADGFKFDNNQDCKIYCGQRYIEVKVNNTSKTYVILEINDQNMVVCEFHDNNFLNFFTPK